jgi:hypothetical protein
VKNENGDLLSDFQSIFIYVEGLLFSVNEGA